MKIEWLHEARMEYRFAAIPQKHGRKAVCGKVCRYDPILCQKAEGLPEMGVLKETQLLGRYGFRALFIGKYVCIYRIAGDTVLVYHIADARTDYMYHIFGIEGN